MKRLVSGILIILMVLQVFYQFTIMTYFYANQAAIAATLCENRDKPQLKCEGKCFLKKQLKKADKQEKQQQAVAGKYEILPYTITESSIAFEPVFYTIELVNGIKNDSYYFLPSGSLFHPPQA